MLVFYCWFLTSKNSKTCCFSGMTRRAAPLGRKPQKPKKKYRGWSYSNREGIDEKLKYRQKPYKMKVWQKSDNLCIFSLSGLVIILLGRALTKNWNIGKNHMKWRVGKKVTNYVFFVYKDLSYSIREGIGKKIEI